MSDSQHAPEDRCFFCASDEQLMNGLTGESMAVIHWQVAESFCPEMDEVEDWRKSPDGREGAA